MGSRDHLGSVHTRCSLLHQRRLPYHRLRRHSVRLLPTDLPNFLTYLTSTRIFLPFPVLLKSQIQNRKKVVLLGLLALGTFITIIQVIRIRTVRNLANYLDSSSLIMWSAVENNMGIIVASIPTLGPLFKYFADKTRKSSSGNSEYRSRPSMYVLKSRTRQGSIPLGSAENHTSHIRGPSEGGSEEFIMGNVAHITKKMEVTVSSEERNRGREVAM
jgi:hypothetical protein